MSAPPFVELILFNAATATLLALLAAAVGRLTRRPGLAHALWALVLVKLLFPPVIEMAVVPRAALTTATAIATEPVPVNAVMATAPLRATNPTDVAPGAGTADPGFRTWPVLVLGTWAAGSAFLLGLTFVRGRRFRQLVAVGRPAPQDLARDARLLACRIGVRCPELKIVAARVSPMLWFPGVRATLLFPAALLDTLDAGERRALLAHELAHVRRRDHLLRFVELLATIAFWWHPVVWWARRMLRRLEEQSCDAEVLHALPGQGGPYARGLVKTVEFLAGGASRMPALASGAAREGAARNLEERLKMILNDTTPRLLSRTQRLLLATAAGLALLIVPSWAEPRNDAAADDPGVDEYRELLQDIEREALELERNMQDLDARRREIELKRIELENDRDVAILEAKIAEAERAGRAKEAEALRGKLEYVEARALKQRELYMIESEHARRTLELELQLRRLSIEKREGSLEEREWALRELTQVEEQRNLEWELKKRQLAALDEETAYHHQQKAAAAARQQLELEMHERALEEELTHRELVIAKLKAAQKKVQQLESEGRHDEAEALRQELVVLKEKLGAEERERGHVY